MSSLVYIVIGVGILIAAYIARRQQGDRREELARRLGLAVEANAIGSGVLGGRYKGMKVRIEEFNKGNGRHARPFVEVVVELPARLPDGLVVVPEADLAKIGKFLGLQDIVVGHPRLDDAAVIKARSVDEARAFFDRPGVADALASLLMRYQQVKLHRGKLHVTRAGDAGPATELVLEAIAEFVEVLLGEREYEPEQADIVDTGYGDMNKVVEQELARRKAQGHRPSFDRPMYQPSAEPKPQPDEPASSDPFGRPGAGDDKFGPGSGGGPSGDGMW